MPDPACTCGRTDAVHSMNCPRHPALLSDAIPESRTPYVLGAPLRPAWDHQTGNYEIPPYPESQSHPNGATMTPAPPILQTVERRRRALQRAELAYRTALVDAIDHGCTYRTVAAAAGLSVGRVHELVQAERNR